jgi:CRP-like cAMP-binding protein
MESAGGVFEGVPDEARKICIASFYPEYFKAGDDISRQGDEGPQARKLYAIEEGEIDFIVEGKGVVNTQYAGSCFGELSLIYGGARTATCHARTNCKVWTLDEPSYRLVQVAIARANRRRRMSQGDGSLSEKQQAAKAQALKEAQEAEETAKQAEADAAALVRAAGGAEEGTSPIDGEADAKAETGPKGKVFELNELETVAIIGYGGFGRITLVKDPVEGETYALKALSKNAIGDDHVRQSHVLAERDALGSVDSRCVW